MKIYSWNLQGVAGGKYNTVRNWIDDRAVGWILLQECGRPTLVGQDSWKVVDGADLPADETLSQSRVEPLRKRTRGHPPFRIVHWAYNDAGNNRTNMAIVCCGEQSLSNFQYSVLHIQVNDMRRRPAIGMRPLSVDGQPTGPWVFCVHMIAAQGLAKREGPLFMKKLQETHPGDPAIMAGDWNCSPGLMELPPGFSIAARGRPTQQSGNELDYAVATTVCVRADPGSIPWPASDHHPVLFEFDGPPNHISETPIEHGEPVLKRRHVDI